jgi:CHASE3 domain sensor protein
MTRRTTTARLLNRAFAVLVLLVLLAGAAGITASVLQHRSVRQISEQIVPLRLANTQLRVVLSDAQRSLRGYLLTGEASLLGQFQAASAAFGPATQRLRALATAPAHRTAVAEQIRLAGPWWRHADLQSRLPPRSPQAAAAATSGGRLFEPFLVANDRLEVDLAERGARVRRGSEVLHSMTLASLAGLAPLQLQSRR